MSLYSLGKVGFPGLALALCILPIAAQSRAVRSITLDPPTGLDLQAHTVDSKGNLLPEAPPNFRRLGEATVGKQADLRTLTLRFSQTTKITGISISKDFAIEQGGSCVAGNVYEKGSTCRLLVRFTPQGPGNRLGKLTVTHTASATPDAFGLGGYGYSPILSFIPSVITTIPASYPSSVGLLNGAQNLAIDEGDTLWVSDTGNNVVRNLDSSGNFKTLASGYSAPHGITVDTFGEAYFSRPAANAMHEIYDYGPVVQINGTGTGSCPASSPCIMSSHTVTNPGELSMDAYNHMFFTEQTSGGAFSTVQPIPANLIFLYDPFPFQTNPASAAAMDAGDNIYSLWANGGVCEIAEQSLYNAENSNVSFNKIAGGHTCGFAGDGGLAGNAEIGSSIGQIAFDTAGDLYFTDSANQRVRRIDYVTGVIRTIAGNGTPGYTGDGGQATSAELDNPTGVGVDSQGQVYIISNSASTGTAQVIRTVTATGFRGMGEVPKGTKSAPGIVTITNTGNSSWQLTNHLFTGNNPTEFAVDNTTTSCVLTAGATLNSGQTCQIGFTCTPAAPGELTAVFVLLGNTVATSNTIKLGCYGTLPSATFKITSPTNGASFASGTAVTFSASVTSSTSPAPTGKVQFKVDGANLGSPVTLSSGAASTSVTGLTVKSHTLSATYSGDSNYAAGGPISVTITVTTSGTIHQPTVTMSPMAKTNLSCVPQTFNVNVSSSSGVVPTGTVHLLDGSHTVSTATLVNGKAVLNSAPLTAGTHSFTTDYGGDAHNSPAVSAALVETVSQTGRCSQPVDRVGLR